MRAAHRRDYIEQCLMEAAAMYQEGAVAFLAEHDAAVLGAAANRLALGHPPLSSWEQGKGYAAALADLRALAAGTDAPSDSCPNGADGHEWRGRDDGTMECSYCPATCAEKSLPDDAGTLPCLAEYDGSGRTRCVREAGHLGAHTSTGGGRRATWFGEAR